MVVHFDNARVADAPSSLDASSRYTAQPTANCIFLKCTDSGLRRFERHASFPDMKAKTAGRSRLFISVD